MPYGSKFKIRLRHYLLSFWSATAVGPKHIIIHQRLGCRREAGRGRDAIRFAELLPRVPHMANGRETAGAQERSTLSVSKSRRRRRRRRRCITRQAQTTTRKQKPMKSITGKRKTFLHYRIIKTNRQQPGTTAGQPPGLPTLVTSECRAPPFPWR